MRCYGMRRSPVSWRRLGAHREAAEQYDRALRHAAGAPAARLAELWECRADGCERSHWMTERAPGADQLSGALEASARAIELWRAVGDGEREVVVVARRSHMLWNAGRRVEAQDTARAAVALLEALPPGPRPARAYAALARLFMLAHDDAAAVSLGTTAVSYAQRYEQAGTLAEALGVVGNAQWTTDPDRAVELLTAALNAARSAGTTWVSPPSCATSVPGPPRSAATSRPTAGWVKRWPGVPNEILSRCAISGFWQARCHLEQGRWGEASAAAAAVIGSHPGPGPAKSCAHRDGQAGKPPRRPERAATARSGVVACRVLW